MNTNEISVGPKNLKLISYATEADETNDTKNSWKIKTSNVNGDRAIKLQDASCQAIHLKNGDIKLKISHKTIHNLAEYRDDFKEGTKANSMYTSKTKNKPWEVVAWIADKLVDEMIVDISNDFQVNDVIEKLFDLELQEY